MAIKRRHVTRDTRMDQQWNSRQIGNPLGLAQWAFDPDRVVPAKKPSLIVSLIEDYYGEACEHSFDPHCEGCSIRSEYERLRYPGKPEGLVRLDISRKSLRSKR